MLLLFLLSLQEDVQLFLFEYEICHVQALVALADEITKAGIPEGSRKINGKYIHSHLISRLKSKLTLLCFFLDLRFSLGCWIY